MNLTTEPQTLGCILSIFHDIFDLRIFTSPQGFMSEFIFFTSQILHHFYFVSHPIPLHFYLVFFYMIIAFQLYLYDTISPWSQVWALYFLCIWTLANIHFSSTTSM